MFEGKILPVTVKLGMPILISNLFVVLYLAADTYFISLIDQSSTALLSGVGLIFPIFYLFYAAGTGISTGMASIISRGIGANTPQVIDMAADSGLFFVVCLSGIALVFGFLFPDQIMGVLSGSGLSSEAIWFGRTYFIALLPAFGMLLILYLFFGIFQGEGLMTQISIASMIAGLSNIVLDPLFIFTLNLGVKGAAYATGISYGLGVIYALFVILSKRSTVPLHFRMRNVNRKILMEIVRIGFPESVSLISLSVIYIALNTLVSSIGESAMSAWSICAKTDNFVVMPAYAIAAATMTMAGQNFGRENMRRVSDIYRWNMIAGVAGVAVFAILYSLSAPFFFSFFSSVEAVVEGAVRQARFISLSFTGVGAVVVSAALFQATGRPIPAMIIRLVRIIGFIVPVAYILAKGMGWGMTGIFIAIIFGNTAILFLSWGWTTLHIRKLIDSHP